MNDNTIKRIEYKKLLIYLYEYFEQSQPRILQEMAEQKYKFSKDTVDLWFKETKTKTTDYIVFWEKAFPKGLKENGYLIYNKITDKPIKKYLSKRLKTGKTIKQFCIDNNISLNHTLHYINYKLDGIDKIQP